MRRKPGEAGSKSCGETCEGRKAIGSPKENQDIDNRTTKNHFKLVTYEYECTACHHAWEAEQSISAAALTGSISFRSRASVRR